MNNKSILIPILILCPPKVVLSVCLLPYHIFKPIFIVLAHDQPQVQLPSRSDCHPFSTMVEVTCDFPSKKPPLAADCCWIESLLVLCASAEELPALSGCPERIHRPSDVLPAGQDLPPSDQESVGAQGVEVGHADVRVHHGESKSAGGPAGRHSRGHCQCRPLPLVPQEKVLEVTVIVRTHVSIVNTEQFLRK